MKRDFSRNKDQTSQFRKVETGNNIRMLVLIGLLISLTLLLPNCAPFPPYVVHAKTSGSGGTFGEKVPLNVGYYITEKFEKYNVVKRGFVNWDYPNLGMASALQFKLALEQLCRRVETIDIPYMKKEGLDVVIEPQIEKFYFYAPPFNWQIWRASITYKITLYDSNWNVLLTRFVEGIGDTKGHSWIYAENASVAASKAIEQGVNKAIDTILTSEEIKTLLRK